MARRRNNSAEIADNKKEEPVVVPESCFVESADVNTAANSDDAFNDESDGEASCVVSGRGDPDSDDVELAARGAILVAPVLPEVGSELEVVSATVPVSRDSVVSQGSQSEGVKNMAISIDKYIKIASSFPDAGTASRSLGGLVFTCSEMLATFTAEKKTAYDAGDPVELDSDEVKDAFGETSNEYKFATGYYGYLSPSGNFASSIKFAKVPVSDAAPAYATARVYAVGDIVTQTNTVYKCSTAVTADENTGWSAVSSKFTAVPAYASATAYSVGDIVTNDSKVYSCKTAITIEENTGWEAVSAKFTKMQFVVSAVAAFDALIKKSNMFGSFTFLDNGSVAFGSSDLVDVSARNTGLDTKFLFVVNRVRGSQAASVVIADKTLFGAATGTVYVSGATAWSGYMPMAILAATDYTGGTVNTQMFKQFAGETPTVGDDGDYDDFKPAWVNFYGRSQSNGTTIDFYQRGFNTNGDDTAVYCNELWFKAECATRLFDVLVGNERIPANEDGVDIVRNTVLESCVVAKANGMFMAKTISQTDQVKIRQLLARKGATVEQSDNILSELALSGYSIWAFLTTDASTGEYQIHYYVIYGTADSIRFISGNDILIK